MDTSELNQQSQREIHYVYGWCCTPVGRRGASFWGVALVLIGAVVLLSQVTPFSLEIGKFLWPALLMAWGVAILWPNRLLQ